MPRPTFKPTEEQRRIVETTSGVGLTEVQIADILNIDPKTLRKYFRRELKDGSLRAYAAVKQTFYQMATSGKNTKATMAWLNDFNRRTQLTTWRSRRKKKKCCTAAPCPRN